MKKCTCKIGNYKIGIRPHIFSEMSEHPMSPLLLQKLANSPQEEGIHLNKRLKLGKENLTPTRPRSTDCDHSLLRSPFRNVENADSGKNATPPKMQERRSPSTDPVTPTANFKMLSAVAASLQYAGSDTRSTASSPDWEMATALEDFDSTPNSCAHQKTSRKERSLSFICDRFLSMYPEYPDANVNYCISIDKVAADLGVERRRMYDIANVLESIDIMRKIGKNKYEYFGKRNLIQSLKMLMDKAVAENVEQQLKKAQNPVFQDVSNDFKIQVADMPYLFKQEKSLGTISQKFLMLFLAVPQPCSISLQVAAQVLMGTPKLEKDTVQFKTKIRRLYDIANIFMSVGLITKDLCQSKQSFKYIGPKINDLHIHDTHLQSNADTLKCHRPVNKMWGKCASKVISKNLFPRTKSECWNLKPKKPKTLVRHLSLHDICAVAEVEREKLYSPVPTTVSPEKMYGRSFDSPCESDVGMQSPKGIFKKSFTNLVTRIKQANSFSSPPKTNENLVCMELPKVRLNSPNFCKEIKINTSLKNNEFVEKKPNSIPEAKKVINLTSEQKKNILKFLGVSLVDGQVATIHINGGNDEHDSVSLNGVSMCNGSIASCKSRIAPNFTYREPLQLVEGDSSTSNSCSAEQNGASPLSLVSEDSTPDRSNQDVNK